MKTYAFELSGEHDTLPKSEALALADLYSQGWHEVCSLEQCLIIRASGLDVQALGQRLAMTHRILEVLAICDAGMDSLAEAVGMMDLPAVRYRIRARRIKGAIPRADEVERAVGRILFRSGYQADLTHPQMDLRAIISGGKIVLGRQVARMDRSSFEARRPHLKPFFYPGVLMPRIARALINLSGVRPGERLLDPFAGTCGILVEACLIGVRGVGIEVQNKLVQGAKCNLTGLDCSLILGDAKRLPFRDASIDAAVMDTPYGRSALIEAESKEDLVRQSLDELRRVLKPGRGMIMVADRPIDKLLKDAGFDILQTHRDRVHRSLTRHIFLSKK